MCGIIGYTGRRNASEIIYQGLKRLEYRGYDSSGAAYLSDGKLFVVKKEGKVEKLLPLLKGVNSSLGIGHTRWATHGVPSDTNSHPHRSGNIAVVHNGIIENYAELKSKLISDNYKFVSDTDSEVVAHLLNKNYSGNLLEAMQKTVKMLKGSYALIAICNSENRIIAARYKSPLILGYGREENFLASDEPALAGLCDTVSILQDGDIAEVSSESIKFYDKNLTPVSREVFPNLAVCCDLGLDNCPHYMLKELREVPDSVRFTERAFEGIKQKLSAILSDVNRAVFVGCGTAYHAAMIGKRYTESFARIPCEAETGGEFRYKQPVIDGRTAVFAISQSGETADTVEAARLALSFGAKVVAVTNSHHSELTRIAHVVVPVAAGPEICVAATKSYTGQVTALYLTANLLAKRQPEKLDIVYDLCKKTVAELNISSLAQVCSKARGVYFLGRDLDYAVAVEGSLKLKEVSYVPGEGYPSGELKHGTLALIDEDTVSVFIICDDLLADKSVNAVEQVRSRGGKTAVFTNIDRIIDRLRLETPYVFELPHCDKYLSPLLSAIAVQKLAYETAVALGRDPDKPRNLAKSVTVE